MKKKNYFGKSNQKLKILMKEIISNSFHKKRRIIMKLLILCMREIYKKVNRMK